MTVKELRYLADNLDEYVRVPGGIERLKKTILHLAVSGQLVPQDPSEGTGQELYRQIQAEKAGLIRDGKLKKQQHLTEITADEILFEIPTSWKWVRLGGVGEFGSGSTPARGEDKYFGGSINWFKSGELTDSHMYEHSEEQIKQQALSECSLRLNQPGDILIAMYGATAGKLGLLEVEGTTNQAVCGATLSTQIDRMYVFNYLLATRQHLIEQSSGAAQPNISKIKITHHAFALPPLREQKRIVEKVDAIFALVDELAAKYAAEQSEREKLVASSLAQLARSDGELALAHLAEIIRTKSDAAKLRQVILHLAVSGQLVPQDPSEGTGQELYEQIQAEKAKLVCDGKLKKQKPFPEITDQEIPFQIPKTWKWIRIREAGYALGQKKPNKDFYYVDVASVDNSMAKVSDELPIVSPNNAPSRARKLVQDGTVIYSTVRPYLLNTAVVNNPDKHELIASTAFAIVHPFEGVDASWILFNFLSPYFIEYVNSKSVGAAYPAINDAAFDKSIIPLPPVAEQKRIVQKTTQLLDLITKLEPHLEK